jgi:TPR repeat protein
MNRYIRYCAWAVFGSVFMSVPARADLYQAAAAVEKGDLPQAFRLFMELAELGHPLAQETIAAMYVNGEGVQRDNALGYGWAVVAIENGGGEISRSIVSQLEPHLDAKAREKAADIHKRFGLEALRSRILPVVRDAPRESTDSACRMRAAANPDQFYPHAARRDGVSGAAIVVAPVNVDGSSRNPIVWYSFPVGVFDEAGRAVALSSHYSPKVEGGIAKACSIIFKVNFRHGSHDFSSPSPAAQKVVTDMKARAIAGDPFSQLSYGAMLELWSMLNKDKEKYEHWFLRAAQAGVPAAQFLVGARLLARSSFEEDEAKGVFWLEKGATGGSGAAQTALASHLLRNRSDPASRDMAFDWLRRAAESRHQEGKFLFAALLVSWPDATRRDPARALALLDEVGRSFDYDPAIPEIRARARALQGDFSGAVREQARAIKVAKRLKWDTAPQESRLSSYEKAQVPDDELIQF